MFLWWEVVLEKVADLGLLHLVKFSLTNSKLDSIDTILLLGLDLSDLAPVNLDDSARDRDSPLVPEVSHAYLVANEARALTVSANGLAWLQIKLGVDLIFKTAVGLRLGQETMLL